jgi:hypothetical protein
VAIEKEIGPRLKLDRMVIKTLAPAHQEAPRPIESTVAGPHRAL